MIAAQQALQPRAPAEIIELALPPGVRRDGTRLDGAFWVDAQWVRFQRGRPRKMNGFDAMLRSLPGVVTAVYPNAESSSVHLGTTRGIYRAPLGYVDGPYGAIYDRTPVGLVGGGNYDVRSWMLTALAPASGSGVTNLVAAVTHDKEQLTGGLAGQAGFERIYYGDTSSVLPLTELQDASGAVAGSSVAVLHPFLFVLGSQGLLRNSNPGDISAATGWTTGGANKAAQANVAASRMIRGMPLRGGGQSPSGLFWSTDSLVRVSYVGGATLWNYDTLNASISVMSRHGFVEDNNVYYWVGVDRFYMFNGVVQELPNDMNSNWFFDNIDTAHANNVYAVKVPRYGEIWWFFRSKTAAAGLPHCDKAVIYNVRERTWYDAECRRSGGASASNAYPRALHCAVASEEANPSVTFALTQLDFEDVALPVGTNLSHIAAAFPEGTTVYGSVSGASGVVHQTVGGLYRADLVLETFAVLVRATAGAFVVGDYLRVNSAADTTWLTQEVVGAQALSVQAYQHASFVWAHEAPHYNRVVAGVPQAIDSYCQTSDLSFAAAGGQGPAPNYTFRLHKVEPDFQMVGDMTLEVRGSGYAHSVEVWSPPMTFTSTTEFIDLREQRRLMTLRFRSAAVDGTFQMGKLLLTVEPGDERG